MFPAVILEYERRIEVIKIKKKSCPLKELMHDTMKMSGILEFTMLPLVAINTHESCYVD